MQRLNTVRNAPNSSTTLGNPSRVPPIWHDSAVFPCQGPPDLSETANRAVRPSMSISRCIAFFGCSNSPPCNSCDIIDGMDKKQQPRERYRPSLAEALISAVLGILALIYVAEPLEAFFASFIDPLVRFALQAVGL
ncbi:MAG: hypothetical protein VYD64_11850 [Pseudomonadota bacterium]|nr:hypothetical protein [Pseudomonadota bacterium]